MSGAVAKGGILLVSLQAKLRQTPVIAGLRTASDVSVALERNVGILFLLSGTIFDLGRIQEYVSTSSSLLFVHIDLIQGVGRDGAGIRWLAKEFGVNGILSTRSHLVNAARREGLLAIQRLFILDSEALRTGLKVLAETQPDAVEILPALILPHIAHRLPAKNMPPIVAGGLVETEQEVDQILAASPALSVSTSAQHLWGYEPSGT